MDVAPISRRARFEAVMAEVYEPLQRYARRRTDPDTADDVVADALLVVWRRLEEVPADGVLPWCYRVAANCLANSRRSVRRGASLVARIGMLDRPGPAPGPGAPADPELHVALATLAEADRELLRLWAWEGLGPQDLAMVFDVTPNAINIRLHRAKGRLAEAIGKDPRQSGQRSCEDTKEVT